MASRPCVKFLKLAMRGCQDDVNFTLKPLFKGNYFRKPVNKGLQKLNAHSACGHINHELTLTNRTYVFQQCGMMKDRDLNAAENLYRAGLARIHACGHDGSVSVPHVTEATSMGETGSESVGG